MRRFSSAVAALAVAGAITATPAAPLDRPQTFSLLEVDESDASTNLGFDFQRLPKPGEGFAFKSSLYRWAGAKRGARVGRDAGICTFIRVAPSEQNFSADALCSASAFLRGGQIHVQGIVPFTEGPTRIELPVVGGTGSYANARGFLRVRAIGSEDSGHSNLEFHLLP